jgi:deoxyribodipyrimidine photo-lyase
MLWKDYFVFWALKHHKVYFKAEYGIYGREHYDWQTNADIIKRVKIGLSGMPIVDAIVRDFNESGHMSYKAKMIFCNYFSGDLRQDWRKGSEYFEARMIDYEPCEIIGKWHQGAGIGPGRIVKYNCLTQSKDHDPKGEYIRRWVHELRHVPDEYIHDPWRMPIYLQKETSCVLGVDYPKPISCIRYTDASKGGPSDRTKAKQKPKKGKPLTEVNQTSMLTFIQVTKEMRQAEEEVGGKENEVA